MGLFDWLFGAKGKRDAKHPAAPDTVPDRIRTPLPASLADLGDGGVKLYEAYREAGEAIDLGKGTPAALDRIVQAAARALQEPADAERAEAGREFLIRGAGVILGTHVLETLGGRWRVDDFGVTVAELGQARAALDPFTAVRRALRDPEKFSIRDAVQELREDMAGAGPRARFQREFLRRLGKAFPERSVEEVRWFEIRFQDGLRLYLGNLYEDIAQTPDRRSELIERYLQQLQKLPLADEDFAPFEDVALRVVPQLKTRSFIDQFRGGRKESVPLHTGFRNGLVVVYAIEDEESLRYLSLADLGRWEIDKTAVRRAAHKNLRRQSEELQVQQVDGAGSKLLVLNTGDGLDAVRLLLPDLHKRLSPHVGERFLAAVPHRNCLIAFPEKAPALRKEVLPRLRAAAAAAGRYSLTCRLFRVCEDGIEEYQERTG